MGIIILTSIAFIISVILVVLDILLNKQDIKFIVSRKRIY